MIFALKFTGERTYTIEWVIKHILWVCKMSMCSAETIWFYFKRLLCTNAFLKFKKKELYYVNRKWKYMAL